MQYQYPKILRVEHLDDDLWFPEPTSDELERTYESKDGDVYVPTIIAKGGDLSVERLKLAYSKGYYPFIEDGEPTWYCHLWRYVVFTDEVRIGHNVKPLLNNNKYEVTFNEDFDGVINACSSIVRRPEYSAQWILPEMIKAYTELHRQDLATSVEVWEPNPATSERKLVGGLYGISTNDNVFIGESAFHKVDNASKLAFVRHAKRLRDEGVRIIDCQMRTNFSIAMGGRFISYNAYMDILQGRSKP